MTAAVELVGSSNSCKEHRVVDDVTATAQPGQVTALLGSKGAGKTITLRILLGLAASSSGTATFDGKLAELLDPIRQIGPVLKNIRVAPQTQRARSPANRRRLGWPAEGRA